MAFIVLEHKGIIQCEVYMCVTIWKIFMYFFMWLYVFFLKFSWRQTWVTKEKGLALFSLKRWIWLISNWSHANVVMRFCPFLLLLNLEIFQLLHLEVETVCFQGFSVIHSDFLSYQQKTIIVLWCSTLLQIHDCTLCKLFSSQGGQSCGEVI